MFCHPYHQTCHPAAGSFRDPLNAMFDMFALTQPMGSQSCRSAYLDAHRAMETQRREQGIRQQQARRTRLQRKERAKPFRVSVIEDSDDALVISIRLIGKYPCHSQLKIAPNGKNSLRVVMTAHRPVHQRVRDVWGHQRLVQTGVEKYKIFSETLSFKTDRRLLVEKVQARAISDDVVIVTIHRPERVPHPEIEAADCADEFEFHVAIHDDAHAEDTPQIVENDENDENDDESSEESAEAAAAIALDVDAASEDSFEIPIDGTVEDCDLDA